MAPAHCLRGAGPVLAADRRRAHALGQSLPPAVHSARHRRARGTSNQAILLRSRRAATPSTPTSSNNSRTACETLAACYPPMPGHPLAGAASHLSRAAGQLTVMRQSQVHDARRLRLAGPVAGWTRAATSTAEPEVGDFRHGGDRPAPFPVVVTPAFFQLRVWAGQRKRGGGFR